MEEVLEDAEDWGNFVLNSKQEGRSQGFTESLEADMETDDSEG